MARTEIFSGWCNSLLHRKCSFLLQEANGETGRNEKRRIECACDCHKIGRVDGS